MGLLNFFKSNKRRSTEEDYETDYFECESDVEAALNYLDNHENCSLEEYEAWLTHREEARKTIKENKEKSHGRKPYDTGTRT